MILITGGTGLIGRALSANLSADGYEVVVLSRYPEDAAALRAQLDETNAIARLSEAMRGEQNLTTLAQTVLRELCKSLGVAMGAAAPSASRPRTSMCRRTRPCPPTASTRVMPSWMGRAGPP